MPEIIFNSAVFVVAGSVIYFFGGLLVQATDRIAHRLHRDGFSVAFVLLGILTSLSEISVAVNSTLVRMPQISAGNLMGASFVIFLLIVPIFAVFGRGITLNHVLPKRRLLLALGVIAAPSLIVLDGRLTPAEGAAMVALYLVLLVYSPTKKRLGEAARDLAHISYLRKDLALDVCKIIIGAIIIFLSGRLLVTETMYFAELFHIPASFIGLLVISIGTNLPELAIAIRAIRKKRKAIAFGDYVGSAAFNTFTIGLLILINGAFVVEQKEFVIMAVFLTGGMGLFYLFSRSKYDISRQEGLLLGLLYLAFVVLQLLTIGNIQITQ